MSELIAMDPDQPVLVDTQRVFDTVAYTAHLRLQDLVWRHCTLNLDPGPGMGALKSAIDHRGGDQPLDIDHWLYDPSALARDPYLDFRHSLGRPSDQVTGPDNKLATAILRGLA